MAWSPADTGAPLATALFSAGGSETGFLTAAPFPVSWEPGSELLLRGPLGRGFQIPSPNSRLALAAFGLTAERLLAVLPDALDRDCAVALCADCPLPSLPAEVEIHPLASLTELLSWAEFLLLDLPRHELAALPKWLGEGFSKPGQALIYCEMPCAGLAECGACAIQGRRGPRLVCKDGPVFPVRELVHA